MSFWNPSKVLVSLFLGVGGTRIYWYICNHQDDKLFLKVCYSLEGSHLNIPWSLNLLEIAAKPPFKRNRKDALHKVVPDSLPAQKKKRNCQGMNTLDLLKWCRTDLGLNNNNCHNPMFSPFEIFIQLIYSLLFRLFGLPEHWSWQGSLFHSAVAVSSITYKLCSSLG